MSMEMLRWHILAAHGRGIPAIVRVPGPNNHAGRGAAVWGAEIKHVLDGGCDGVVVPMVRSAEEVRTVVADCRYPTGGGRPAPNDKPVSVHDTQCEAMQCKGMHHLKTNNVLHDVVAEC
jgi:2-keto-3-deoxy-L-rhamnonate aldolase RhmA